MNTTASPLKDMQGDLSAMRALKVPQVAEVLGVSDSVVWGLIRESRLRSVLVGTGCRRVLVDDLRRYVDDLLNDHGVQTA